MDIRDIYISTGYVYHNENTQLSRVIKATGVPNEYTSGTIRISLEKDNSEGEIDAISTALQQFFS